MHGAIGLVVIPQAAQTGHNDILQIGLAGVDHVVHTGAGAEVALGIGGLVRGDPQGAPIRVGVERTVVKILAEQAELPKLVGDVLADVGDGPIGPHDHLALFGKAGHHPAAVVLAFGLEVDGLAFLEQLERGGPELHVQNFAFARQHVVFDVVEPQHGRQMRLHDAIRHQVRHFGQVARTGLDRMERFGAPLEGLGVVLVVAGNSGVEGPSSS